MPVDPHLAALLQFIASAGKPMSEGTPEQARRSFRTLTVDLRDARVTTLYEGTSQIQKLLIGRALTGISAF